MKSAIPAVAGVLVGYFALVIVSACFLGSQLLFDWLTYFVAGISACISLVAVSMRNSILALTFTAIAVSAAVYPELSHQFHLREVEKDKKYVAGLAPLLEKYRKEHGQYPASLASVPSQVPIPSGLQYDTLGYSYYVIVYDPQSIDYDRFDSAGQSWRRDN